MAKVRFKVYRSGKLYRNLPPDTPNFRAAELLFDEIVDEASRQGSCGAWTLKDLSVVEETE